MNSIERIKELTAGLLHYCHLYYDLDSPSISDAAYDKLYDELYKLENEAGFWLANSPTRKVQGSVMEGFTKVKHSKPMLSAAKTKDSNEIKKFVGSHPFYCSYKLDGATLLVCYENGQFKQAITRGDGINGEDVTEQAKMIKNLPMQIPYKDYLELRGECIVSWEDFNKINEKLEEPYSHPRNLASGSLRNLDTNITRQRNLSYVVFECVSDLYDGEALFDSKWDELGYLDNLGFETVERVHGDVDNCIEDMPPKNYGYPVDGLIFEMCMKKFSKSLGATGHHEGCRMALKWKDEAYETILRDVVWDVGRSGVISPVAVFDEIDLDGAITSRATLHNLSVIESLELGIGDTITVYRSNMVIPKVDDNLTRSNTLVFPKICPCCGASTEIKYTDNSKFLMCSNPNCKAKTLAKFTHFVSKLAMNIENLSGSTLEKFINNGWLNTFADIYRLDRYKDDIIQMDGFGTRSYEKLIAAIEKSRNTTLDRLINAIGIPNIGKTASKEIAKFCNESPDTFCSHIRDGYDFTALNDFGQIMANSIRDYFNDEENMANFKDLINCLTFIVTLPDETRDNLFNNKTVVVTGSLNHFTRESITETLERLGAKVASSVSKKTDYLIAGEKAGSKLNKAKELGVQILTEDEFLAMSNN